MSNMNNISQVFFARSFYTVVLKYDYGKVLLIFSSLRPQNGKFRGEVSKYLQIVQKVLFNITYQNREFVEIFEHRNVK